MKKKFQSGKVLLLKSGAFLSERWSMLREDSIRRVPSRHLIISILMRKEVCYGFE